MDSWLIWKLTGGKAHVTDYTNASRTMLYNIHTLDWDDRLLEALDIPRCILPQVMDSSAIYGYTTIQGGERAHRGHRGRPAGGAVRAVLL